MAKRSNPMRFIMVLGGLAFVGVLLYISFEQTRHEYEVCVSFQGAMHCATAKGATSNEAVRSAQEIDCELLTNGRDENMACLDRQPASVREVK
jgi:hypothetical protein